MSIAGKTADTVVLGQTRERKLKMPKLNENYLNVKDSYLFAEIARRVKVYEEEHPEKAGEIIRLGIGDVTRPLTDCAVRALHEAVEMQADAKGFKGYGPEQGYEFVRKAVSDYYASNGIKVDPESVFISDGAKSDTGNITELFAADNVILVPDPVYPVYVDTNIMDGKEVVYMNGNEENNFLPMPDESVSADIIYLCSPNNPTGACYSREQLKEWVDYALKNEAVILFDAAYEAFVSDPELPRSIYAVKGAEKCAVEFCSLSKTAGFTGTRFSYTIVPKELVFRASDGQQMSLHDMWNRRQSTKFNGTPYIIQYAAAAVLSEKGMEECMENIRYYMENARVIAETLTKKGIPFTGGLNSPYIWFKCPDGMESWEFFDCLLDKAQIVGTPGAGFGENGKNYFRLTSFGTHENTKKAMERFDRLF